MNGSVGISKDFLADFRHIQKYLEHAFGVAGPMAIRGSHQGSFPAINIGSTPETIEIVAFAPGIDAGSLDLTIDRGLLTAGERKPALDENPEGVSAHAQERHAGLFRRVISLPEDADPTKVNATYREGLLRVSISKRESSRPHGIDIK